MRNLIIFLFLLFFSPLITYCNSTELIEENNFDPSLLKIYKKIKQGYDEADFNILLQANSEFEKINLKEEKWEEQVNKLNIYKWPLQSSREAIGGHLFYPSDVKDLFDYYYLNHFLKRTDTIWGFAISAKYKNPLGHYYLACILDSIDYEDEYGNEGRNPFITDLYNKSFTVLEQSYEKNPEACYVLGINHADYALKTWIKDLNIEKAFNYHKVGARLGDHRNELAALETQRIYKRVFKESPKVEDYISLANKGYMPSYLALSRFQINNEQKVFYIKKTIENKLPHGFIEIGKLYEWMSNKEEAFEYYKKAATLSDSANEKNYPQKVIATGYFQMAKTILGDIVLDKKSRENLNNIKPGSLNEATSYLQNAANLNDPQACEQLIVLYKSLYEFEGKDHHIKNLKTFLEKGMKLGLISAYNKVHKFFPEEYESFVKIYGVYQEDKLTKVIRDFYLKT